MSEYDLIDPEFKFGFFDKYIERLIKSNETVIIRMKWGHENYRGLTFKILELISDKGAAWIRVIGAYKVLNDKGDPIIKVETAELINVSAIASIVAATFETRIGM